jgi:hypothetical protein
VDRQLGQQVTDGERLGALVDSFGRTEAPLVNSGDAIVHIAT